jgi:hypothetical protein
MMDLETFDAKVHTEFNMCPNMWKFDRERMAAFFGDIW